MSEYQKSTIEEGLYGRSCLLQILAKMNGSGIIGVIMEELYSSEGASGLVGIVDRYGSHYFQYRQIKN